MSLVARAETEDGGRGKKSKGTREESSDKVDRDVSGEKIDSREEDRATSPIRRIARFCIASRIERKKGEASPQTCEEYSREGRIWVL